MRKQLMTGVAAAAICLGLASCSRFDYTLISEGEQAYVNYENAFIEKFGEPAPDQTWGFGSADANNGGAAQGAATRAATRAVTRAIPDSYNFPEDAPASKFLSAVPDGVEKYSYGKKVSYIDASFTGQRVELNGAWVTDHSEPQTLYIKGNVDLTNGYFYAASNSTIYLVEGATLKLNSTDSKNLQYGCNYYIAENASIITEGELRTNCTNIYNHGTISAYDFYPSSSNDNPNSGSLFYNRGTFNVTNHIGLGNAYCIIVNDGDLNANTITLQGGSKLQNNGTATINGQTRVDSNNLSWVNNGTYTTGSFSYTAGSYDVKNNCKLTVNGDFYINLGDTKDDRNFFMDSNASTVTNTLTATGPFYIIMCPNAVFKVNTTATLNASKQYYGIYGLPTTTNPTGYAVFQAKDIVAGSANQGYEVTYGGNLYVTAETHFAQGYSGQYPYIGFEGGCSESNIFTAGNMPNYSIASSECNPGFNNGPVPLRVIAEDLTASEGSDFDFNDVVFDIQLNWPAQGKHKITLQAAGGKLPLRVGVLDDEHEVHNLFGVDVNTMVNTEEWTSHKAPVSFFITGEYTNAKDIKVWVKKGNDWCELKAEQGKAASKIGVPSTFKWVKELKDIEPIYTKFKDYVSNPSIKWWETISDESQIYNAQ